MAVNNQTEDHYYFSEGDNKGLIVGIHKQMRGVRVLQLPFENHQNIKSSDVWDLSLFVTRFDLSGMNLVNP